MQPLLDFIREIDRLKNIERQTLLHNGGRRENSAEHSWHLALSVMAFQSFLKTPIDVIRAVKMALVHDLVEIDAGDTFIYGDQSQKAEQERAAIDRITSILPEPHASELKNIWLEFEEKNCPESKFVSALDRFLPVYSNYLNNGSAWRRHGIRVGQVLEKNEGPIREGIPELWPTAEAMIRAAHAAGHLAD